MRIEIDPSAPIVQITRTATEKVLGADPAIVGEPFWMDSALLADAGIDTVIVGPTGDGLHSDLEWVDVESVYQLAHILQQCALAYCR